MQRITIIRTARGQRHRSQQLANGNYPLADAAMAATLGRLGCNATVHGMRSAFSTWAHERTGHSNHVIEMCLAHTVGIDIEKAYRRTDQTPRRLSPGEMARLLVAFGIRPKTVWPPRRSTRDRSVKGYHRKQFEAAWAAYCEGTPAQHGNVKYLASRTKNAART